MAKPPGMAGPVVSRAAFRGGRSNKPGLLEQLQELFSEGTASNNRVTQNNAAQHLELRAGSGWAQTGEVRAYY